MTTKTFTAEELALLSEAVEFEIEHANDMIREMPDETDEDREAIRVERVRQERLEALFANLSTAPAGHPRNAHQPFITR